MYINFVHVKNGQLRIEMYLEGKERQVKNRSNRRFIKIPATK